MHGPTVIEAPFMLLEQHEGSFDHGCYTLVRCQVTIGVVKVAALPLQV